jgi:3-dehydroquinate synthase
MDSDYTMTTGTQIVRQQFRVSYEYPVAFTENLFDAKNPLLNDTVTAIEPSKRHRILVVIDDGVAAGWPGLGATINRYALTHGDTMEIVGDPVVVPGGEACKNDETHVDNLRAICAERGLDRHSFVMVIGGGAVLDMAGYAAATAHRGIRLIRVPTTVLAQNDAGVGVKNGINAFDSKNFLGTFCPPFAVLNDVCFIDTLETRDKRAGMAEAVKVALIRDPDFFHWLQANSEALARFERPAMAYMIKRCAELHLNHIATSGDPFEYGSARPLDFGHWAAHKLEVLTDHALRHGEAVAIGIALDSAYSVEAGLLESHAFDEICRLFSDIGLACTHELLGQSGTDGRLLVMTGLEEFRQHLGGQLTVTMLEALGAGVEVHEISETLLQRSVDRLLQWRDAA